ncbi:hypothetical protein PR002_g3922 [Phytophthora rubi]|nr:hypothetical protein PR002_g3922 [Phytophthora rubi]
MRVNTCIVWALLGTLGTSGHFEHRFGLRSTNTRSTEYLSRWPDAPGAYFGVAPQFCSTSHTGSFPFNSAASGIG